MRKKIVTNSLIVGTQLVLSGLFLVGLFNVKAEDNKVAIVENNNLDKMADVVTDMFKADTIGSNVFLDKKEKEEEKVTEDEKVKEDKKEVVEELNSNQEKKVEEEIVKEPVKEEPVTSYIEEEKGHQVLETYVGSLTGYGPNCAGCSGMTASGYNVSNTSTYTDYEYGEVRIVAADRSIPFYSIVRINIPGSDPFIAVVLDTGGAVGFNKATLFDLLFPNESVAMSKVDNVTFEILRRGQ